MDLEIVTADYTHPQHARDIVFLLDHYASDPAGGGEGLSDFTKSNLVAALARLPHAFSLLCYLDGQPAGLVNCFVGFSTFQCKPLVNIHDIVVLDALRGKGIGPRLLQGVEAVAREKGACKLTLEVLDRNGRARAAYAKAGFSAYELDPAYGRAVFLEKVLAP
jgi:GNAT superfamily N-acetyltransferase